MEPIYIPRLTRAPQQSEEVEFDQVIAGLETLTPVHGRLRVTHQSTYLEVSAVAETIVTLTCHRCLQQYNYRLSITPKELIWLDESADPADLPMDRDINLEDLVESLPPTGFFDPQTWLYEQLCLAIPQRQLCDSGCKGIPLPDSVPSSTTDRRWASLESLKNRFPS